MLDECSTQNQCGACTATAHNGVELTILLPCLNEGETISDCISKARASLERAGISGEVVVADNGSIDRSDEIAKKAGARVVHVERRGYGSALRGGIEAANGRWIIIGDADGSYDFSQIEGFFEKFRDGFDLVMGCRFPCGGGRIACGAMSWKNRWIGNPILSLIGRILFKSRVNDFHSGLRGFTMDSFRKMDLRTLGMEFASEMVIKATLKDLRIGEIPITLHPDGRSRPPHLRPWRDGWRHLRLMLLYSPGWLFIWPGLMTFLIGLGLFVPLAIAPIKVGRVHFDTNTLLVASMMIIVGFQITFFGTFTNFYCVARGLLPENQKFRRISKAFSLERGAFFGLFILLVGLGYLAMAILAWRKTGFGNLLYPQSLRLVIPAVTLITVGVQTIFSSFFLAILDLAHD